MENMTDIKALMEEVNPVYITAQRCLQVVAGLGDQDAIKLCDVLGLPTLKKTLMVNDKLPREVAEALELTMPVFNAIPEARFLASTNLIQSIGTKQVVDLPCGYTSRGIKLAKSGISYFGFDLPAVTGTLQNAVKQIIGENDCITYCPVDATNYDSLKKALTDAKGELLITTEGMLMYFTQSELETVFSNIRRILSEFGGRWVTVDSELDTAQKKLMRLLTEGLSEDKAQRTRAIVSEYCGKASKTTLLNNKFYDPDPDKVKQFVSDMGFDLEMVPMKDYLPESIDSFKDLAPDIRKAALDILGAVNFWIMTVNKKTSEELTLDESTFNADIKISGSTLNISVSGRLDTITAPGLLSLYKEAAGKGNISDICIDMKDLDYISSAGLRVLLIMRKAVDAGDRFNLINMDDVVKEIIETTGFDTIMC